jgi:hypothetical protein
LILYGVGARGLGQEKPDEFFTPHLSEGQRISQIFSRTISIKGEGFTEKVSRASGSATYTVERCDPNGLAVGLLYNYDGRVAGKWRGAFDLKTGNQIDNGKQAPTTDASGLIFNRFLWGTPPEGLRDRAVWTVHIGAPWELGPPGNQTVTIIAIDHAHHTITLMREGSGKGLFANERDQITVVRAGKDLTATVIPEESHWFGYTTFREGIVISDSLLVERPQTLVAGQERFKATERQYILLNAIPSAGQDDDHTGASNK